VQFREDISPEFIPSQRNRTASRGDDTGREIASMQVDEEIDANSRSDGQFLSEPFVLQGQSIPPAESPPPARIYPCFGGRRLELFADPTQRRSFGTPSNTFVCGRVGMIGSCRRRAREVLGKQIGNDNWGQQPFRMGYLMNGTCSILICITGEHVGRSWN